MARKSNTKRKPAAVASLFPSGAQASSGEEKAGAWCGGSSGTGFARRLPPCAHQQEIPLPAALFYHVFLLSSVLERAGNRQTEQHGLTLPQWMALGCIGRGGIEGITHSELGSRLMLSKAPITGVVDRLERAGYVMRVPDPNDRRISRVVATEMGNQKWETVRVHLREMAAEHCGCLSEKEQHQFLALLERLLDTVARADPILQGTVD